MRASQDNLKHIVVVMLENRSFDHMLGGLRAADPRIEGLTGSETNPDTSGQPVKVQPLAEYQGQITVRPSTRFAAVDEQLFYPENGASGKPLMQGFVQSYFDQRQSVQQARKIMYYFAPEKLPVLTTLAQSFAVFNYWFSSVPGPGPCNHAFAHFGSSFGRVDWKPTALPGQMPYLDIFQRMSQANRTAKLYYFDSTSGIKAGLSLPPANLGTYDQFFADCRDGTLPDYSFVEPNHTDHLGPDGTERISTDQHPDHNVQSGEIFIASVYNAIRANPALWSSTALLIVYSTHGGFYDHVAPPSIWADPAFTASPEDTGTGFPFAFDRLGVRVPAVLVSPWIARGTVVELYDPVSGGVFDHSSIPATVTEHFLGGYQPRSQREEHAPTFLHLFGDQMRPDSDCPSFAFGDEKDEKSDAVLVGAADTSSTLSQELAGYHSDEPEGRDLLDITREVEALATVLAAHEVGPPLSLGLFGDWGTGKSFFMGQLERRVRVLQEDAKAAQGDSAFCENIVQITFNAWNYIDTSLWASLTSEIFEGLAAAIAQRTGEDSRQHRARMLAAASSSQTVMAEAERKKSEAVAALRETELRLAALESDKAVIEASLQPAELFKAAYQFAIEEPKVQGYIEQAGKALHVQQVEAAAGEVKSEILELRGIWSAIFFTIRNTEKLWIWIVAPAVAIILGWGATLLLRRYSVTGLMEEITAILTAAASFVAWFLPGARKALSYIQRARAAQQELIDSKRAEAEAKLKLERQALANRVADAQKELDAAAKQAKEMSDQLEQLEAARRMADYIRQRNQSTDYTQHLGLIARVRADFKQLSTLLRDAREESDSEIKRRQKEKDSERKLFPRIDRIILYIDDLDRCPEKNVVEVLQAVNLLLAFPLFVVVVGVDPRWLLHSLEQHSSAFSASRDAGDGAEFDHLWQSTPLNYLEKIFQIPYTLRPMDSRGFGRLVDTLSKGPGKEGTASGGSQAGAGSATGSAAAAGSGTAETTGSPAAAEDDDGTPLPVNRRPDHLRIESWEQSFMKLLHELMPTPRAGKRFINIYRLIRASVADRERAAFIGDAESGGEHQCALLLLAILTGHPAEATEILRELIEKEHEESWWTFIGQWKVKKLKPRPGARKANGQVKEETAVRQGVESSPERWQELFGKLERIQPKAPDQPCKVFAKWAPRIARFSFQSGRVLFERSEAGQASR